ncbi:MAG: DUF3772 domain-containing protein, partial [Rhodanobacteraceae bacterium]
MHRSIDAAVARFDDAAMLMARILVFLLLVLIPISGFGQDKDAAKFFDDARQQIDTIRKQLSTEVDESNLNAFRDGAAAIAAESETLIADRKPKLAELDARLAELGPPPAKGEPPEAADIVAQRAVLEQQREPLDAETKRAKLLAVDSQQLLADIAETRTASFQARLSQRTPSPLTPTFWRTVAGNLVNDVARLGALRIGVISALRDSFAPDNIAYAIGGIVLGLFLVVVARWWIERKLMRLTADRVPHGRLRRSALALAIVVVTMLFTGLGVQAIVVGLDWHNAFTDAEKQLGRSIVSIAYVASFISGLGRALLSAVRPSWRLPPISDGVASALRFFPVAFAGAVAFNILIRHINTAVGASIAATIAATLISAILYCGLLIWALVSTSRARNARQIERAARGDRGPDDGAPVTRTLWIDFIAGVFWFFCVLSLGAAAIGFIAFAQFVVQQVIWVTVVAGTFYLLVHLIE